LGSHEASPSITVLSKPVDFIPSFTGCRHLVNGLFQVPDSLPFLFSPIGVLYAQPYGGVLISKNRLGAADRSVLVLILVPVDADVKYFLLFGCLIEGHLFLHVLRERAWQTREGMTDT